MVACVPCGINSPINKGKANSATPLLPGVGEMQRITHITNCLAKTKRCSPTGENARSMQLTTKKRDVHEKTVHK